MKSSKIKTGAKLSQVTIKSDGADQLESEVKLKKDKAPLDRWWYLDLVRAVAGSMFGQVAETEEDQSEELDQSLVIVEYERSSWKSDRHRHPNKQQRNDPCKPVELCHIDEDQIQSVHEASMLTYFHDIDRPTIQQIQSDKLPLSSTDSKPKQRPVVYNDSDENTI